MNDQPQGGGVAQQPQRQPQPTLLDRSDVRVKHASGFGDTLAAFWQRVRSGDLGSLPVIVGLAVLHFTCLPYNKLRKILMVSVSATFLFCITALRGTFGLVDLSASSVLILVVFALLAYPFMRTLTIGFGQLHSHAEARAERRTKPAGRHLAGGTKK